MTDHPDPTDTEPAPGPPAGRDPVDRDPAGLGRGVLTRWMPVFLRDPAEPTDTTAFRTPPGTTTGRFLGQVVFSLPRVTVPAMLCAVAWQVGESAVPVVMGLAIDRALGHTDAGQLALWVGVLIGLYVLLTTAARFSLRLNAYAIQLLQYRLRTTLSRRVLHPAAGTAGTPDGSIVSVMTNDVTRLANAGQLVITPVSHVAAIVFIAVSLLSSHWLLGVAVLAGAPTVVWLMGRLSTSYSRNTREYQGLLAATVGRATDLVAGYRVVKGIRAEDEVSDRYRTASQETLAGAKRNAGFLGRFLVTSGAVNGTFVALVMGLAGWLAVDGRTSIGGFIAAVGLTQALLPHVSTIANASVPNYASARASAARILEVLQDADADPAGPATPTDPGATGAPAATGDPASPDASGAPASPDVSGDVDPATAGRAGTPPELQVTVPGAAHGAVTVHPGELVGVRAGDRTAARLAGALLTPWTDQGAQVTLGGVPAEGLSPQDYRRQVTVAPHRTTLFSGTVQDNIVAGAAAVAATDTSTGAVTGTALHDGTPERVSVALHAASCDDFATPDTAVGEGGNLLSGGQQQRVALARALASGAPVLVLHDPTTAVDSVTEHLIAGRLREAREGLSTLVIASSPVLLDGCDRVVDLTDTTTGPTDQEPTV